MTTILTESTTKNNKAPSSPSTKETKNVVGKSWTETFQNLLKPDVLTMLLYGFSAGLPIMLIFAALSLWLSEAGINKSTITFFSWAALAYSFKFLWAPIIDQIPVPLLSKKLGRRRGWLLTSQLMVIASILLMAGINPALSDNAVLFMAFATICLGFSSATQDIVIDAYRIEVATPDIQALLASAYIGGYRIGMLASGAGALLIADSFGTSKEAYQYHAWQLTYVSMAALMLIGVITTLSIKEPKRNDLSAKPYAKIDYVYFFLFFLICASVFVVSKISISEVLSEYKPGLTNVLNNKTFAAVILEILSFVLALPKVFLVGWGLIKLNFVNRELVIEGYWNPIKDFFTRYEVRLALLLLLLIGFYRISDIVLGTISYVFYSDMGFSKTEIGAASKTFGIIMTIIGGFLGGVLAIKYGVLKILFLGALLSSATNLLFMVAADYPGNLTVLYLIISADNISGGLANTAFIAFLGSLTNVSFSASQYAIFSSLMTLFPKTIGGYSGTMVEAIGYSNFFWTTFLMGIPILALIVLLKDRLKISH